MNEEYLAQRVGDILHQKAAIGGCGEMCGGRLVPRRKKDSACKIPNKKGKYFRAKRKNSKGKTCILYKNHARGVKAYKTRIARGKVVSKRKPSVQRKRNPWITYVKKFRRDNPDKQWTLSEIAATYEKIKK